MVSVSSSVNRCLVDSFSEAAATKDHKLSGLKQQQFILSQLERPEVPSQVVSRTSELVPYQSDFPCLVGVCV